MRIVSHSCSNTEIICALGAGGQLVGVDDHSDYPPDVVNRLPRVGPDLNVDPARVAALSPDLVVVSDTVPGHDRVIESLRAEGLPLLITAPRSLFDIATDIRSIAAALDLTAQGEQLAADFLQQLQQAGKPEASDSTQPLPVLIEWWPKPVIVPGRQSWATQLIELAGGSNPWANEDVASLEISTAQAQAAAPELIIMSWCGVSSDNYRPHIVRRRAGWENIPAVRHNRILPISEAWLGRPGPRLTQGLHALRRQIQACTSTSPPGIL